MKKLSDYQGEDAIELWADLLEPLTRIFGDTDIQQTLIGNASLLEKAKTILGKHKRETTEILVRIDPTPLNGMNIIGRLMNLITEFQESGYFGDFFESQSPDETAKGSSGDVTENTTAAEK